jgi:hypothetical protein
MNVDLYQPPRTPPAPSPTMMQSRLHIFEENILQTSTTAWVADPEQ